MTTSPIQRFIAPVGRLSAAMREAYLRDGYLVLDKFVSEQDCSALSARADELIDGFELGEAGTVFDPVWQSHGADAYFRESGDKIHFFLEPGAIDSSGGLVVPKSRAINKIGHALHDLDPLFERFSHDPKLAVMAEDLGLARPTLIQSMLILKQPRLGEPVGWHQDATYLYTEPLTVTGFWIALEDANEENGCLITIPGGHLGPLRQRYRDIGGRLVLEEMDPTPWPEVAPAVIEAPQGTLVVLHGLLPHASGANRSSRSRYAYALHAIDWDARYPQDNWLKRGNLPKRGFS